MTPPTGPSASSPPRTNPFATGRGSRTSNLFSGVGTPAQRNPDAVLTRGNNDGAAVAPRPGAFGRLFGEEETGSADVLQHFLGPVPATGDEDLRARAASARAAAMGTQERFKMLQDLREDISRRRAATAVSYPTNAFGGSGPSLPRGLDGAGHRSSASLDFNRPLPRTPALEQPAAGEMAPPRWQPDAEVSECPICGRAFAFWYRKHHCRKCGRVVCSSCSPHRITIPRQFIVHPPVEVDLDTASGLRSRQPEVIDLTGDGITAPSLSSEGREPFANPDHLDPSFGGGQEVRLCNPCVPDPNPLPAPAYPSSNCSPHSPSFNLAGPNGGASSYLHTDPFSLASRPDHRSIYHWGQPNQPPRTPNTPQAPSSNVPVQPLFEDFFHGDHPRRHSSQAHRRDHGELFNPLHANPFHRHHPPWNEPEHGRFAGPADRIPGQAAPASSTLDFRTAYGSAPGIPTWAHTYHPPAPGAPRRGHHVTSSDLAPPAAYHRSVLDPDRPYRHRSPSHAAPAPPPPPAPPPAPPIAEEDECPICHLELPPKGPGGDESVREAHVQACIETHFSSSAPRPVPVGSEPATTAATTAWPAGSPARRGAPSLAGGAVRTGEPAGPVMARRRTTGMVVYYASEKDCVGEEGAAQECVICFEEFAVGDEMGRLECLCKFHKACIRTWWDTKGVGACPVHQGGL